MIDFGFGLALRTIGASDLDRLREERNKPEIWRWCRQSDLISEEDQKAWYFRQNSDPTQRMYLICVGGNGVGVCGLTSVDTLCHRAEFSLYVFKDHQNQGYGRKALRTLFTHGFRNIGLNLIWGETFEGNHAIDLFISLGMTRDGVRRDFYFKDGQFQDSHLISIKACEWKY